MDRRLAALALTLLALTALAGCADLADPGGDLDGTDGARNGTTLAADYRVTVTGVIDGDTVRIRFQNGSTDTVRLLGVDTPETNAENSPDEFEGVPDTAAGRECLGAAGREATRFATDQLLGETVSLRLDAESDTRGYYDRLLAYVVVDGANFNHRLVARGYARVYDSTFTESDRFYDAESAAQENGTRVWACRTPGAVTATATVTASESGLTVATVNADAAGRDGENLNDEYVVFENRGDDRLDLSGWTVTDEADHRYTVPAGVALAPGDRLTLHTGSGTDTAADLYWGRGSPVWNNDGDTVTVRDASGAVVVQRSYAGS
jgi:micrococcal nuclease